MSENRAENKDGEVLKKKLIDTVKKGVDARILLVSIVSVLPGSLFVVAGRDSNTDINAALGEKLSISLGAILLSVSLLSLLVCYYQQHKVDQAAEKLKSDFNYEVPRQNPFN